MGSMKKSDCVFQPNHRRANPPPVKCPGCGSYEWRIHNNGQVCAYCRTRREEKSDGI